MNKKVIRRDQTRKPVSGLCLDSVSGSAKVTKLLALANDSGAFEGEREVALRKAANLTERVQPSTPRVTERNIDTLPAGHIYRETGTKGLGLRVTAAGARSWILDYSCNGRQRRFTIGPREGFALKAASNEARRLIGEIAQGRDPFDTKAERESAAAAKRESERRARDPDTDPTVGHLAELWIADARRTLRANSITSANSCVRRLKVLRFDQKKVREVTWRDVHAVMVAMHKTPVMANRIRSFLSAIFNFAIWHGVGLTESSVNPARKVKGVLADNRGAPRRVIVPSQKQIDTLHAALDARAGQPSADAIRLMLLTGARKNEVLRLEWSEIENLHGENPVWLLPAKRAKQKKDRAFPLADPQVLDLLRRLHAKNGKGRFVFPGRRPGAPLRDITNLWTSVRDAAGLSSLSRFRLHDLRHVFVSRGLNAGVPIYTVGQLVGHSSAYMTSRYGHGDNKVAAEAAKLIGAGLAPTTTANTNDAPPCA